MKAIQKIVETFLLCSSLFTASAQTDSAKTAKPQFKISLNYNTGSNYYGRTDSLKSTGFFPLAELWLTQKFYINAAPIFVNNALQKFEYAGSVATMGYQNVTKKSIVGVYVSKPIYKESSELVQSALKLQSGINLSLLNKYVNVNVGGDVKLSDKVDFGTTGGLTHLICIENKDSSVLVFDPAFYVHAGSQNFQRSYYEKTNSGFLFFPGNEQLVTEDITEFKILAYEATMPIVFAKKQWTFIATPSYIIPQNLITVRNRPDLSERGGNMFYATLTAKYTF
jgi:hypothetical protein